MFFAGVSIVILSGLVMLFGITAYLIGWVFSFNPNVLEFFGKVMRGSLVVGIIGIVLSVIGGGNL